MPYDTVHTYEETIQAHTLRLKRSQRWTKIRRRALLLKLDGLDPDAVRARMGESNCPYSVATAGVEELMQCLAVTRRGKRLIPAPGREPNHTLATIQDDAQALGLEVTIRDLTRGLAGDSNKLARAQAGVMLGRPPYGYRKVGTRQMSIAGEERTIAAIDADRKEAAVVVFLFEQYVAGLTFPQIADQLNGHGQRTRSGKLWTADTLRDMLRNPVYAGFVLYRGTEDRNRRDAGTLYPGLHPAIISWETFCAAQDARVQRHPQRPRSSWTCPWENAPR